MHRPFGQCRARWRASGTCWRCCSARAGSIETGTQIRAHRGGGEQVESEQGQAALADAHRCIDDRRCLGQALL
ncbi:hypothetical protein CKO42_07590 [Lamprobacter modestohalophilus]|uniref:Uncharacterized protein n=1 Tax=Lamprobacter modestohalophilus TaxID=1064514 RepID=A0A9X0W7L1_9GAMM|nr:hypothetical protein [Lamprobacter modestohalophilus]